MEGKPQSITVEKDFICKVPKDIMDEINLHVGDIITFRENGKNSVLCETSGGYSFIVKSS